MISGVLTAEPFAPGTRGFGVFGLPPTAAPEPKVDVASPTPREVQSLARDPAVRGLAPIMPTKLIQPVNIDVGAATTPVWGIAAVGADRSAFTGADVVVAVSIPASMRPTRLLPVDLIQKDFSGRGNGDRQGHGTHCAGTIFGRDSDGVRIGIARGVHCALIGKVLGDNGSGPLA